MHLSTKGWSAVKGKVGTLLYCHTMGSFAQLWLVHTGHWSQFLWICVAGHSYYGVLVHTCYNYYGLLSTVVANCDNH